MNHRQAGFGKHRARPKTPSEVQRKVRRRAEPLARPYTTTQLLGGNRVVFVLVYDYVSLQLGEDVTLTRCFKLSQLQVHASLHELWVFADGLKILRNQVFLLKFVWNDWNVRSTSDTCVEMSFCEFTAQGNAHTDHLPQLTECLCSPPANVAIWVAMVLRGMDAS